MTLTQKKLILNVCLFGFLSATNPLTAQVITNSQSSANYLANEISISSGYPVENYVNYAGGLAKTLSLLSEGQQAKIFGNGGSIAVGSSTGNQQQSSELYDDSTSYSHSANYSHDGEAGTDDDSSYGMGDFLSDILSGLAALFSLGNVEVEMEVKADAEGAQIEVSVDGEQFFDAEVSRSDQN